MVNTNLDTTPLPPNNFVAQDPQSAELAGYVRTKTFGRDVRESIARSIELNSTRSKNAEELANETLNVSNDLTERFNQQIGALTEDSEVIDARGGKATLGQRLDETTAQLAQTMKLERQGSSFVEKMLGLINVKGMYLKTKSNGMDLVLNLENDERTAISYQFRYNADNLLLLRGVLTAKTVQKETPNITLNGTYISASAPQTYTITEGDSFSFSFVGTGFSFNRRVESRGGMWEFLLNDGSVKRVSCFSGAAKFQEDIIFEGLPHKEYSVVATFIGDDPANPPTDGTARGYVYYDPNHPTAFFPVSVQSDTLPLDGLSAWELIHSDSIPDFAISAKPLVAGSSYGQEWVPHHGSVAGVSRNVMIKVNVDGMPVVDYPGGLLPKDYLSIDTFEIVQRFDAFNPNGADGAMWRHYVTHTFKKNKPVLEINNRLEILQDTAIGNMYLTMLPGNGNNLSRMVLNNGEEYDPMPSDGTDIRLGLGVSGAMFAGQYENGRFHGAAVDVDSYAEAISLGNHNEEPCRITFRSDKVVKFYLKGIKDGSVLKTGEVYRNTQRIACVNGIKVPNYFLKSIS